MFHAVLWKEIICFAWMIFKRARYEEKTKIPYMNNSVAMGVPQFDIL